MEFRCGSDRFNTFQTDPAVIFAFDRLINLTYLQGTDKRPN